MRYGTLGPVEVWDGGRPVAIGGPQQRAVLAVLLLYANQVVSADRLIDLVWGEQPPPTARGLLHGCIAGLRRALKAGKGRTLLTRAPGYLLEVAPGELDSDRFEELLSAGEPERALELWRGPALDGLDLEVCRVEASRLEERRLAAIEARIDNQLALGGYHILVPELQTLVRDHPLRERFWGQLMRALHGAQRQADALEAYRRVRELLVDQLGVEPGLELQGIHRTILAGDPPQSLSKPLADKGVPAQLPAAVAAFTGREHDLKRLDELAACGMTVGVVCGTAGVGKTALTVHWGHSVRGRFPDGQLYVNLRGYAPGVPVRPVDALSGFLRELGLPAERVPADEDQAAALYRSLLADRRVLVVLDNAADADQVRPLLPGGAGCLALVTSRDTLGGLVARDGASLVRLEVLVPDEGCALLAKVLGRDRVEAEADAAAELVELCARLPLALRIAAANLTIQSRRSIADYVAELATQDRLGALAVDGDEHHAVQAAFDLSYRRLPAEAQRLFRLLALLPGPDVTADAAAALTDGAGAGLLKRLARAHLLDEHLPGRFTFHDLLRSYASERAAQEESAADRARATGRLYQWYLDGATAAADLLYPAALRLPVPDSPKRFAGHPEALSWLDSERANLVAAVVSGARLGQRRPACLLADTLRGFFQLRRYNADWLAVAEAALAAAEQEADPRAQAAAHTSLGTGHRALGEHRAALRHYAGALRLSRRAGWRESEALTLGNLGIVLHKLGRLNAAARRLDEAIAIDRATGRRAGEANNLANLGNVCLQSGRLDDAARRLTRALQLHRAAGNHHGQALALTWLGETELARGRLREARDLLTEALEGYRRIGDRDGQAVAHHCLSTVDSMDGRTRTAYGHAQSSLALARDTGDRLTEATALNALGEVHLKNGRYREAIAHHEKALALSRETAARRLEIEALIGLAACHRAAGEPEQAHTHAMAALGQATRHGYRVLEERARKQLLTDKV